MSTTQERMVYGLEVSNDSGTTVSLLARLHIGFIESVENIIAIIPDDKPELIINLCETVIRHCDAKKCRQLEKEAALSAESQFSRPHALHQ